MCTSQMEHLQIELHSQLLIGDTCSTDEKDTLLQLLLMKHQVFALSVGELRETDLVQHKIEMKEVVPFRTAPHRFLYALRAESETELTRL